MEENYLLALSLLYRNTKKYFDRSLGEYGLGWGQVLPLLLVNEHAGITMQELTERSVVDKGTTSKVVQSLLDSGYLKTIVDGRDRRVKHIYTTAKASEVISTIYYFRQEYGKLLSREVDFETFLTQLNQVKDNSEIEEPHQEVLDIRIGRYEPLNLVAYPGKVSAKIYLTGCNFKCPYCYEKELVFPPQNATYLEPEKILDDLKERKNFLEAVCISGGEPCLQNGLIPFLKKIKEIGLQIKVETNGSFPLVLQDLVKQGLIDFIQLDIKNQSKKMAETVGLLEKEIPQSRIQESLDWLKKGSIPYEIHTTVVKELHCTGDLKKMKLELEANPHWKWYPFQKKGQILQDGLKEWTKEEWNKIEHVASKKEG